MRIVIATIPPGSGRIPGQIGDWTRDNGGTLQIRVTETGDDRSNACVALHELMEALACEGAGVAESAVDAFDTAWRPHDDIDEAGNDRAAPYFVQHQYSTVAEHLLAMALSLPWVEHERLVDAAERAERAHRKLGRLSAVLTCPGCGEPTVEHRDRSMRPAPLFTCPACLHVWHIGEFGIPNREAGAP